MSSSGAGGGSASARPKTSFAVLAEVPLKHLPNSGRLAVQRQRGGYVPDEAVQFYLGWSWDAPNGGRAWKGGGSVQAGQVQAVIDALAEAYGKTEEDRARAAGGGSADASPATGVGEAPPPTYVALAEVPLKHLPNGARFVVQRQRGGKIPDGVVQLYLGWSTLKVNGGTSWAGGGSVLAEQIPDVIDALARACESETGERPSCGVGVQQGPEVGRSGTFADLCDGDDDGGGSGGNGSSSSGGGGGGCVTFADALDDERGAG